jgi:hypothetical protein
MAEALASERPRLTAEGDGMAKGNDEVLVQLATRIPKELHRRIKLHCVQTETAVMEFVVSALEEKLAKAGGRKRAGRSE